MLSQLDEPRYNLDKVDFTPGHTPPQRHNSRGDSPAISKAESEAECNWTGDEETADTNICTPQPLISLKQDRQDEEEYENADIIASNRFKNQPQQTTSKFDDTIPELPSRSYLNDTEFIHELNTELFPEIGHQTLLVPVGNSMLPELPERRYLEDTDFDIQLSHSHSSRQEKGQV